MTTTAPLLHDETSSLETATPRRPTILETRVVTGVGGGPDKTILNTPRFIDPYGYRTICAFFHPPEDPGFETLRARAESAEATLVGLHDRGAFDLRLVRNLIRLCRSENVAVWHGHDYKSNALGLLIRRFHPMRLITTVHGWVRNSLRSSVYYQIDRWCLPKYERVICVSDDLRSKCLAAGVPEERCLLVENAIDVPHYERRHTPAAARSALGLPAEGALVAAVGRLSIEKNFPLLIQAIHQLLSAGRQVTLAIAGDGPEQSALQSLIERLGQTERIRLLGFLPDPRLLYEATDIMALSSDREGLPNVLLEAMALRVPVVSTRVAGVPRLLEHERSGLLTPIGDREAMAAAIDRMILSEPLRRQLGEAGRQTIEDRYSFDARMRGIARIYESLKLESPVPSRGFV